MNAKTYVECQRNMDAATDIIKTQLGYKEGK